MVPDGSAALHVPGQSIAAGVLVTFGPFWTESCCEPSAGATARNVAETWVKRPTLISQTSPAVFSHAPCQEASTAPGAGAAVRRSVLPRPNFASQKPTVAVGAPQAIPGSSLSTVPGPPTVTSTLSGSRSKTARTVAAASMVTTQVGAAPTQPVVHARNAKSRCGTAVSVTSRPVGYRVVQRVPQPMRRSAVRTAPLPWTVTLSVRCEPADPADPAGAAAVSAIRAAAPIAAATAAGTSRRGSGLDICAECHHRGAVRQCRAPRIRGLLLDLHALDDSERVDAAHELFVDLLRQCGVAMLLLGVAMLLLGVAMLRDGQALGGVAMLLGGVAVLLVGVAVLRDLHAGEGPTVSARLLAWLKQR